MSFVGGGYRNEANGDSSIIPGGQSNIVVGDHSFAAGYRSHHCR